ncbi:hypothetical protein HDU91_002458, partial [Kappamyces sp. JEL0680]
MHAYEGTMQQAVASGTTAQLDNSAPWCGQRYSVLNVARVVAIPNMSADKCNQCIEIIGSADPVYVLVIDQREAYGLDIAESSYQALFPGANILDPQTCQYRFVDPSLCGTICYGSSDECTPGVRNLLPSYLLAPTSPAPIGLSAGSTGAVPKAVDPPVTQAAPLASDQTPPASTQTETAPATSDPAVA